MKRKLTPKQRYNLRQKRLKAAKLIGRHTSEQWLNLKTQTGLRCVRCCRHQHELPTKLEKDHIIPIYQGGSDGIENLQPLCKKCNTAKRPENFNWVKLRIEKGFDFTPAGLNLRKAYRPSETA